MNCPHCNKEFEPYVPHQVTCGDEACTKAQAAVRARAYRKRRRIKLMTIKCPDCLGTFLMDSSKAVRCNTCARKNLNRRQNERRRELVRGER